MSKLKLNKAFDFGFLLMFSLFLVVHIFEYILYLDLTETNSKINFCVLENYYFGIPFTFYEKSALSFGEFRIAALVLDVLVAFLFSLFLGMIFNFVWSKIASRKLK